MDRQLEWTTKAIDEIKRTRIPHRNWSTALSEAFSCILACNPGEVVCITGPSRVGKSKLISELNTMLVGDASFHEDKTMPVVTVLATNCSTNGMFSTKAFTLKALDEIGHPFFGVNAVGGDPGDDLDEQYLKHESRIPEGVFRKALENGLVSRRTKYLFIDEAQHVLYAKGGVQGATQILDSWKALAQYTEVVLILVGTYPLHDALCGAPHLLGRKHQVHLPRYHATKEDLTAFAELVNAYSEILSKHGGQCELLDHFALLYYGSAGCIGLLEKWLRGSLAHLFAHGGNALTEWHLRQRRTPKIEMDQIMGEIIRGERILAAFDDGAGAQEKAEPTEERTETPKKKAGKKGASKPFQKKQRRHKVGLGV